MADGSLADIYMDTDTVRARLRALENLIVAVLARDPAHAQSLLDDPTFETGDLMATVRRGHLVRAIHPYGILGPEDLDHEGQPLQD